MYSQLNHISGFKKLENKSKYSQYGTSLIEVLVTLLIMSSALLALAALQTRSLQFNQGAYLRSQANIYAYDMLDRMRINLSNINAYNSALAAVDLKSSPVTSPLAAADLDAWRRNIATVLPNGRGGINCNVASNICTLTIEWDEISNTSSQEEDKTTFTYSARL
ncbi:type IV pilus modification protein PilV [Cellvibrio japonicus]|uniref:type IV pilus modification protein PilV n=1 Tax=Cellvibrio japonicus TaxID=155077 RepID=UPI000674CCF5|nr:type IV pilus modification protein PilV [Cellvibrio japonicus]QEI13494.1 type IV pilus modification protein PilV [Cellvibrio japonicus]QEI17068.1 type IV pilus modification protein PilV [Cellvibrio japonicus]QEI20646.1 type IV pilus modification protein PilV [Cellvibrio japonicus]